MSFFGRSSAPWAASLFLAIVGAPKASAAGHFSFVSNLDKPYQRGVNSVMSASTLKFSASRTILSLQPDSMGNPASKAAAASGSTVPTSILTEIAQSHSCDVDSATGPCLVYDHGSIHSIGVKRIRDQSGRDIRLDVVEGDFDTSGKNAARVKKGAKLLDYRNGPDNTVIYSHAQPGSEIALRQTARTTAPPPKPAPAQPLPDNVQKICTGKWVAKFDWDYNPAVLSRYGATDKFAARKVEPSNISCDTVHTVNTVGLGVIAGVPAAVFGTPIAGAPAAMAGGIAGQNIPVKCVCTKEEYAPAPANPQMYTGNAPSDKSYEGAAPVTPAPEQESTHSTYSRAGALNEGSL